MARQTGSHGAWGKLLGRPCYDLGRLYFIKQSGAFPANTYSTLIPISVTSHLRVTYLHYIKASVLIFTPSFKIRTAPLRLVSDPLDSINTWIITGWLVDVILWSQSHPEEETELVLLEKKNSRDNKGKYCDIFHWKCNVQKQKMHAFGEIFSLCNVLQT